ncbi:endonuclease domain-containing protein [Candidatus Bathyarchaeota archaeon]|nr:endonuclease domain-containing protein [Candidatus Bathyarchaeota archaeon]
MLFYSRRRRYHKRSDPAKFDKAYEMRNNPTRAEACMWDILRRQVYQNFPNYIFYRQSVQYGYILDFYCPRLRLGIEVDGYVHDDRKEYDWDRDNALARHGIEVHRYGNDEVLYNPQETAAKIYQTLKDKSAHAQDSFTAKESCFIATAAYGTPMAQEINTLRRFRDLRMEPNLIGRYLVTLYYNTSPPLARVIARSKNMKAFVRLNLKLIIRFLESSNEESS